MISIRKFGKKGNDQTATFLLGEILPFGDLPLTGLASLTPALTIVF